MPELTSPMEFPRVEGWQGLLDDYVRAAEHVPFEWSGRNCTTFAAGWVTAATGRVLDVPEVDGVRTSYRTLTGLGGLHAEACRQLGDPVLGTMAQCGDVALLRLPRARGRVSHAFGVCLGSVVAAQGPRGLFMVPITEAEAAWRV